MHSQNSWLRRVQDRSTKERTENTTIRYRERTTSHILHGNGSFFPLISQTNQFLNFKELYEKHHQYIRYHHYLLDACKRHVFSISQNRYHQSSRSSHCDWYVNVVSVNDLLSVDDYSNCLIKELMVSVNDCLSVDDYSNRLILRIHGIIFFTSIHYWLLFEGSSCRLNEERHETKFHIMFLLEVRLELVSKILSCTHIHFLECR